LHPGAAARITSPPPGFSVLTGCGQHYVEAAATMRRWTGSRRRAWCRLVSCTRSRPVRARCHGCRRARRRRGRRRSGRWRRGRTHARRRSSGIRAAARSRISSPSFRICRVRHGQRRGYAWRGRVSDRVASRPCATPQGLETQRLTRRGPEAPRRSERILVSRRRRVRRSVRETVRHTASRRASTCRRPSRTACGCAGSCEGCRSRSSH